MRQVYEEVGGETGLERILLTFYERMRGDTMIGFFFDGRDVRAIALQQKAFLMRAWGVTASYQGRSPADAHAKLPPILRGHFDRRLQILAETLRNAGLSEESAQSWLGFERKFRKAVQHP